MTYDNVMHQGKSVAEWERLLKKDFNLTQDQILKLIRSGVDLGRMLWHLDEDDFNSNVFQDEEFFFNENNCSSVSESYSIKNYVMPQITFEIYTTDTDNLVFAYNIDINEIGDHLTAFVPYFTLTDERRADDFARNALPANKQTIPNQLRAYLYLDGKRLSTNQNELEHQLKKALVRAETVKRNTLSLKNLNNNLNENEDLLESFEPEDVVTVKDFIELLRHRTKMDDKLMFRAYKKEAMLFDVNSKGGTTVVDIIPSAGRMNENDDGNSDDWKIATEQKWQEAADWFNKNGYPIEDDESRLDKFAPQMDQFLFKVGCSPTGKDEVVDGPTAWKLYQSMKTQTMLEEDIELTADSPMEDFMTVADLQQLGQNTYKNNSDAWLLDNIAGIVNGKVVDFSKVKYVRSEGYPTNGTFFLMDGTTASLEAYEKEKAIMLSEKEKQDVNEGRGWYGGGYGGTGRSYSKLGGKAPRGEEISWFPVEQLDPKAKGKMPGWRCGPSNFSFKDLFFPNRKYKKGTMAMKNKYVKAGPFSGVVQIYIPSYFEIIKTNNKEGIEILNNLGIPLDLTFGMDPNDDYSMTYTV